MPRAPSSGESFRVWAWLVVDFWGLMLGGRRGDCFRSATPVLKGYHEEGALAAVLWILRDVIG